MFVLVPGAGGSGWAWHLVAGLLRAAGHEAVAVDLPAADEGAGLSAYAQVIVEAGAGAEEVVLVAHSFGGLSAPLAVGRVPVRELVLVNAMIPAPGESGGDWWAATGSSAARRANDRALGRDPDGDFDLDHYFFHDVPAALAEQAMAYEQDEADIAFAEPWPLPAWPDVPTRVVAGADDRLFPVAFQERVARERLGLPTEVVPGGHMVALSHPAELTGVLLRGREQERERGRGQERGREQERERGRGQERGREQGQGR
ncbi:alpha/beta fold hydrolase [Actinoplanes sp. DH11]|uniref:alpha/beta fold hydrolase n=1 Tax=Actinoplanes sp. DH11 TaxID=2857011 RepID=UPI001E634600|nr:alpha/beta fold hydrolase [Actinoplanes sp. DH11]